MASDNVENEAECVCNLPEEIICEPKCPENTGVSWECIARSVNTLVILGMVILCLFHPDDLDAEPEEFAPDPGLIGWRPFKDEAGGEVEPEEFKADLGWRPLKEEVAEVEPEEFPPDWGWRPLPEDKK